MTLAKSNPRAIEHAQQGSADYVPHLEVQDVIRLAEAAKSESRYPKGDRDYLLIQTLFDGCFRVSECLQITPQRLHESGVGWAVWIVGKGSKRAEVALSATLVAKLHAYSYLHKIQPAQRLWPMDRSRVHRIVDRAFQVSGLFKPEGVGTVHVLRHSGAIARLAATGNPKAVQDHLRHADARMTLRYLKTISKKQSLVIQQGADLGW